MMVSIRAPAWRATLREPRRPRDGARFNPRPPAWRATNSAPSVRSLSSSFNPRPRVEGDGLPCHASIAAPRAFQSAPPRGGRPAAAWSSASGSRVFQSAPPRGGRHALEASGDVSASFQSAPPRGGRLGDGPRKCWVRAVSIRAPAWRATRRQTCSASRRSRFNPRPRVEGDGPPGLFTCNSISFNPRPRVEGDLRVALDALAVLRVSIRAPAWRATRRRPRSGRSARCFNPRPRVEGRPRSARN